MNGCGCGCGAGHWLNGWLDEVAIFDKFLSEADVSAIYNKGKGTSLSA
jgi:hypothetical protein